MMNLPALISEVKVHNVTALLSMEEIKSTVQLPLGDINFQGYVKLLQTMKMIRLSKVAGLKV